MEGGGEIIKRLSISWLVELHYNKWLVYPVTSFLTQIQPRCSGTWLPSSFSMGMEESWAWFKILLISDLMKLLCVSGIKDFFKTVQMESWNQTLSWQCIGNFSRLQKTKLMPFADMYTGAFKSIYSCVWSGGSISVIIIHYRLFDTDRNGYIDFKEFIIALHASKGSPRKRLQWAFR